MMVKICGLRRPEDADAAIGLGATHIGVVLAQDSPRCATRAQAREIADVARGVAKVVLVFRRETDGVIRAACDAIGVARLQVHGAERSRCELLAAEGLLPTQVLRVEPEATSLPEFAEPPTDRVPALLDGGAGGAGQSFSWALLGPRAPHAVFVAGGIGPANVGRLLQYQPWGIDVSSGVELEPGVKDPVLMSQLFYVLRTAGVMR